MTLQVEIIQQQDGGFDQMIGDAVLARFDGDQGGAPAVQAAREMQTLSTVVISHGPLELVFFKAR